MKFLYPLAKRFVAGYDFNSAIKPIEELLNDGYGVSINLVGERHKDIADCVYAFKQYLKIIKYFKEWRVDISIKPSQIGLLISPEVCFAFLHRLTKRAKEHGHTIRLDMEDSSVTDETIRQAVFLNKEFGNVGVALQANLKRTIWDIEDLIREKVSVRLVKGAYRESEELIVPNKEALLSVFVYEARMLKTRKAVSPAIATHDEAILSLVTMMANSSNFNYEFLYGIRRDLQERLKQKGYRVRIYVPFGKDWLNYSWRRLKEWKNLRFVLYNIVKEFYNKVRYFKK